MHLPSINTETTVGQVQDLHYHEKHIQFTKRCDTMNHHTPKRPILAEFRTLIFIILIVALLLAACNRAEPGPGPQATIDSQGVTPAAGLRCV